MAARTWEISLLVLNKNSERVKIFSTLEEYFPMSMRPYNILYINNGKSVSLFCFSLNFDHHHKTNVNIFPFLEKTPVHQVILYNDEKHVEGSLFETNQMDCDRQKRIAKELIHKLLLQLLILRFRPSSLSYIKRNGISRKKTTICGWAEIAKPAKKYDNHSY